MYKCSIDLFRVNPTCLVKFNIVVNNDTQNNKYRELVNKFTINGDTYFKLKPSPYVTFDIFSSIDRKEGVWNNNFSVNLNRLELYKFINGLKQMYIAFTKYKDLFVISNNETFVNTEVSEQIKIVMILNNKSVYMEHCTVLDVNDNLKYEGIRISINKLSYFTMLTYMELGYLISELSKIDMTSLSLQLLYINEIYKEKESEKIVKPNISESLDEEIVDTKTSVVITDPKQIPEI